MSDENEEERGEKKGKRRKKRTKRGVSEEDVTVLFRWRPLKISVKVESWRVAVVFLGEISWRSLRTSDTRVDLHVVPEVTDVPDSPSSVVTEFCDGFFVLL